MTSFHRARLERKALKDKKVLWYVVFTGRSALSDIKHDATGKCFRSDQARTASVFAPDLNFFIISFLRTSEMI